jgi:beta-phosphoglucomutase-like phosphatase (HAD superfamily)
VSKKKPDPEIYNLALSKTGLGPEECVVIEDSHNGVLAARQAGMHIIATINFYTAKEDLSLADIIVSSLGDPDGKKGELLSGGGVFKYNGVLEAESIISYFSA